MQIVTALGHVLWMAVTMLGVLMWVLISWQFAAADFQDRRPRDDADDGTR